MLQRQVNDKGKVKDKEKGKGKGPDQGQGQRASERRSPNAGPGSAVQPPKELRQDL